MAMMFEQCLAQAVTDKKISQKTADQYKKYFADAEAEAAQAGKAGVEGYTFATSRAAENWMKEIGRQKKMIAADILRTQRIFETIDQFRVNGKEDPFRALQAYLGERLRGSGRAAGDGVVARQRAAESTFQKHLTDLLLTLRSKNLGLTRDVVHTRDMVKEGYGIDSKNAGAKQNLQAYREVLDRFATWMDGEGAPINRIEDYLWPQRFNADAVRAMGPDNFREFMLAEWHSGGMEMRNFTSTSGAMLDPRNEKDVAIALRIIDGSKNHPGAYRNIITGGDAGIEPGVLKHETIGDRYNRRRVFTWKTHDAYQRFQETMGYGMDSLGDQMLQHIRQMAHDLGTVQALGADADRTARTIIQYGQTKGLTPGQVGTLEKTWFHASGRASAAQNVTFANLASSIRLWLTGAMLHSAALGSFPDFAFSRTALAFNGFGFVQSMNQYLKDFAGNKRLAMQMGMISHSGLRGLRDHFDDIAPTNALMTGQNPAPGGRMEAASFGVQRIAGQAAEFTMRGTFLDTHSIALRNSTGMAILGGLADDAVAARAFAALDPRRRAFLERYGINAEDWDILRTRAMPSEGDKLFMDPAELAWKGTGREREAAHRLQAAIEAEAGYAVLEGGVATRAMVLGNTERGTFTGEFMRSLQFKGFVWAATMKWGWRTIDTLFGQDGTMPKGAYLANLVILTTLLGALSNQLKNIATGKDPESMDSATFWAKAFTQGGAGGMAGDYAKMLFQMQSKADAARLLTPTAAVGLDLAALTGGNIAQFIHGGTTNTGREGNNFLRKYLLPRLWYTNLGVDRLLWDQTQRWVDPDASGAFYRLEQRARKDSDQSYWFRPGQVAPERAPDLGAAIKDRGLVRSLTGG